MNLNATLIGQAISFAIFVWFCMTYIWPPIIKALDERKEKIAQGLNAAEEAKHALQEAEQKSDDLARDAKAHSAQIVADAQQRAAAIVTAAKEEAVQAGDNELAAARTRIEQETAKAREELRASMSNLVMAGVHEIVGKEVDAQKHSGLIEDLARKL